MTVLIWLRWDGGECWQRVFDIGEARTQNGVERVISNLYLTPRGCPTERPLVGWVDGSGANQHVEGREPLSAPLMLQLGFAFDSQAQSLRLIVNGEITTEQRTRLRLAAVRDMSSWLGRSRFTTDPNFRGRISELRIYASALGPEVLQQLYARGPDTP